MHIRWSRPFRRTALLTTLSTAALLAGCGASHAPETLSETKETQELAGSSAHVDAVLQADVALDQSFAREDGGWLVMFWKSARDGRARLATRGTSRTSSSEIQIQKGASVLALGPSGEILKAGHVTGHYEAVCGPQGQLCTIEIGTVRGDLEYPCGPQGVTCRVTIPNTESN